MFGSWKDFFDSIKPSTEFPTEEINVCTTQGKEKHPKDYFWTNIGHQKDLLKECYSIHRLFWSKKYVMAIVTLLIVQTVMAIVTALAIETNIHGYCNRFSHCN